MLAEVTCLKANLDPQNFRDFLLIKRPLKYAFSKNLMLGVFYFLLFLEFLKNLNWKKIKEKKNFFFISNFFSKF